MPVKAICTAESYDLEKMIPSLRKWYSLTDISSSSVVHVQSREGNDIFIFRNGSFVVWGTPQDIDESGSRLAEIMNEIRKIVYSFEYGSLLQQGYEMEDMLWRECDDESKSRIVSESILEVQKDKMKGLWSKLAMSNGLSDSVKLAVLEGLLDKHVLKIRNIPIVLEQGRRIPVGRAETLRLIGELLHFRAALNLNSDFLDTPEIYWTEPALEDLYKDSAKSLDTRQRISVLNKKIDYAEKIAELLRSHLNESHMFRLEWAIVLLVGFEVLNSVLWWFI